MKVAEPGNGKEKMAAARSRETGFLYPLEKTMNMAINRPVDRRCQTASAN
jgi:hypothetical protein